MIHCIIRRGVKVVSAVTGYRYLSGRRDQVYLRGNTQKVLFYDTWILTSQRIICYKAEQTKLQLRP